MNDNSRTLNSIKNIVTGFAGQFIQIILGFISRTIFIKFLATEYLGINGLFTNILSVLSLAELGVGSAIIYALYKPLADKNEKEIAALMNYYAKAYKTIGLFITFVGIALMPFLNIIIKKTPNISENIYLIYLFFLFNTVISYFYSYKNSIITADQKNYIAAIISYIISIAQTLVQIIVLITTKNFILYLSVQSIFILCYNITISKTADRLYPFLKGNKNEKLSSYNRKSITSNIRALMIIKLSGVLVNNTDNMIITYFSGLATVGLCSNYNLLIGIISTVLSQLFFSITASIGNLNATESKEKQKKFFDLMNFANFWLYAFSSICILILINDVIKIWIGIKYVLPYNISIILAVNFYMIGMQNAVWTFKNTLGLFRQGRYLLLVTAILNLILSILLGKIWGLFGILFATAISRLVTNTWYDPYVVFKYGLKCRSLEYFRKYLIYLSIFLLTFLGVNFILSFFYVGSLIALLIKIIICAVLVNITFILFFQKSKEYIYYKNMILQIKGKIRSKLSRKVNEVN